MPLPTETNSDMKITEYQTFSSKLAPQQCKHNLGVTKCFLKIVFTRFKPVVKQSVANKYKILWKTPVNAIKNRD